MSVLQSYSAEYINNRVLIEYAVNELRNLFVRIDFGGVFAAHAARGLAAALVIEYISHLPDDW